MLFLSLLFSFSSLSLSLSFFSGLNVFFFPLGCGGILIEFIMNLLDPFLSSWKKKMINFFFGAVFAFGVALAPPDIEAPPKAAYRMKIHRQNQDAERQHVVDLHALRRDVGHVRLLAAACLAQLDHRAEEVRGRDDGCEDHGLLDPVKQE